MNTLKTILISTIAATFAGATTYLAHMAQWGAMFGGGRSDDDERGGMFGMLFMAILALNANPATAHMFIVNPLTGGGMMSLFSTHPPIPERVQRLEDISRTHDY